MFFYLTSRIVSACIAFLYPGYASFKVLSQRPASEDDLERWLKYWCVLGCIIGVEYVAEWFVSWIPFYFIIRTLFLLYLVFPQTQGSTFVYNVHLAPFLHAHEGQIDAALASLRARAFAFLQDKARAAWDSVAASTQQQQQAAPAHTPAMAPPTMSDPVSGPTAMLGSLWRTYGPAVVASGAALLSQGGRTTESGIRTPPGGPSRTASRTTGHEGSTESYDVSGGRFEEVEVPSDAEGEDGAASKRQSSWFGWGGGPSAQGYVRVKSE
ncbi:TB2/DP1, HVA22 family-domain-containing protein [Vararia minispora EC-137]|uniref:TB2/DP1, HVA22 family-domain-containing protein n=1 Tax=Vararia minispora EC-137 TaxID=1314806 RepID=A0ACB8QJX9_9AGAM|nr:TB2/DP1, HVA22 family-domain-containing protein [Vararia minispora EC-137]